jgi:hypothetical protein
MDDLKKLLENAGVVEGTKDYVNDDYMAVVDWDENPDEVVEKINELLFRYGIKIVDEGETISGNVWQRKSCSRNQSSRHC